MVLLFFIFINEFLLSTEKTFVTYTYDTKETVFCFSLNTILKLNSTLQDELDLAVKKVKTNKIKLEGTNEGNEGVAL